MQVTIHGKTKRTKPKELLGFYGHTGWNTVGENDIDVQNNFHCSCLQFPASDFIFDCWPILL